MRRPSDTTPPLTEAVWLYTSAHYPLGTALTAPVPRVPVAHMPNLTLKMSENITSDETP